MLKPRLTLAWLVICLLTAQAWADQSILTIRNAIRGHRPALAADARGNVHLVYQGKDPGTGIVEIFYLGSPDRGQSWRPAVNLSRTPGTSSDPAVCVDAAGAVNVAWIDTTPGATRPDVYFARSTDGGLTWTRALDVSRTPGVSGQPAIAAGPGGSLHVVWIDTTAGAQSPDVWYSRSQDNGQTWSASVDLSKTPGVSYNPAVAAGPDGRVHVVWVDTTSGPDRPDVFYVDGKDGQFSPPVDVSNTPGVSSQPRVAATGSNVYVAWVDASFNQRSPDIFLSYKRAEGAFSDPADVSETPGVSSDPYLTADAEGHVAVVWVDNYGASKPDVYVASSLNAGLTFSRPVNLSRVGQATQLPSVALTGQGLVAVWEELVDGQPVLKLTTLPSLK